MGEKIPLFKKHKNKLPVDTDLNSVTEEGIYIIASAQKIVNAPLGINKTAMVTLIVVDYVNYGNNHQFTQNVICGNTMFTREFVSSWTAWLKIGV